MDILNNNTFMEILKGKVLIFSLAYAPFVGGAELAVKEITDRVDNLRFDMITLRFKKEWPAFEKIGNINVYRIDSSKLLFPFRAFLKAHRLSRKNRYGSIWAIMANRAGFAALFFKIFHPKINFLLTLQEGDPEDYPASKMGMLRFFVKPLFNKIFRKADHVQAISSYLADWAGRSGAKAPIEVVPNGADFRRIKKEELKIKKNGSKVIITTSRLVYKNGLDVLIKAAAELKNSAHDRNFVVQILGAGPEEDNLKKLAKESGVESKVQFIGHVDPDIVYQYLQKADIFARPSRSEGLGSSFLEAMAAGLPIIGTPVGGIPDFLIDGETGIFCKVDDPKDLADKIKTLIDNGELYEKIAQKGQESALRNYNWDNIAKKMEGIFDKLNYRLGSPRLKVLVCTGIFPPDIGGPATYSKLLLDELPKRGVEVEVLSFGLVRHLPKVFRHLVYFSKALSAGRKADIVFAQDPASVGLPSLLAAKVLGKKFVLKIVGDYAWEQYQQSQKSGQIKLKNLEEFQDGKFGFKTELRRKVQKFVAKKAARIIVPSRYLKNIVLRWGVNDDKIKIVYNSFEAPKSFVSKEEARKNLNLSGAVLVSAGRLVPWKGFGALIEIMPDLAKEIRDLRLCIIGSGPESQNLKSQISNLKIDESVFLIGQVSHEKALNYLAAGDVFLLNTGYEGFSHLLLEAMAVGIPIITTSVGGNVELIESGKNGLLAEYNNKNEIKKAILELFGNQGLKDNMVSSGKEKIKEFGKEKMLEETIAILRFPKDDDISNS